MYLPELLPPADLADVLTGRGDALGILADTDPACPPLSRLFDPPPERVYLLVGPAGGWTDMTYDLVNFGERFSKKLCTPSFASFCFPIQ